MGLPTHLGHQYVFYVLEVDGAPIVITLHFVDSEHAEARGPEVEEILNSIRWIDQG